MSKRNEFEEKALERAKLERAAYSGNYEAMRKLGWDPNLMNDKTAAKPINSLGIALKSTTEVVDPKIRAERIAAYKAEKKEQEEKERKERRAELLSQVVESEVPILEALESEIGQQFSQQTSIGILSNHRQGNTKMGFTVDSEKHITGLGLSDHYNQLRTLPESIGQLNRLEILGLQQNNFETLPESIGNLLSLRELDLRFNHISTLPESIGNLLSLRKLDLDNCPIKILPESFGNLKLEWIGINKKLLDKKSKRLIKQAKK